MTSAKIADQGGWRSPANVGVALQQMEKANGSVVRRKSPTVKQGNGMPATEWRHADKRFDGDHVPDATKLMVKESSTTESPKPTAEKPSEVEANLRQQIARLNDAIAGEKALLQKAKADHSEACKTLADRDDDIRRQMQRAEAAERNRDDLKTQLETAERAASSWLELAADFDCKSIPELRVFINATVESLTLLKSENVALKTLNESMPGFGGTHQAIGSGPFVVRIPGKPAVFASKYDNAKAAAMSAARQKRGGEVFALIPLGKAFRGAEWREKA